MTSPRISAVINGLSINSVLHADIVITDSTSASNFQLTLGLPDALAVRDMPGHPDVSIAITPDSNSPGAVIFEGVSDSLTFDPLRKLAALRGRDMSGPMRETSPQNTFTNLTVSEIATLVAARYGFIADVLPTSTFAGSYSHDGYNQMVLNGRSKFTNDWDLLAHLARLAQYEVFLDGRTLVCRPLATLARERLSYDVKSFFNARFRREYPRPSQSFVVVKSWNSWLGKALTHSLDPYWVSADGQPATSVAGPEASEIAIAPDLMPDDAERLAMAIARSLNDRELTMDVTMAGDVRLKPRDTMIITNAGTVFDREYLVRSIHRRYSASAGYQQFVRGTAAFSLAVGL